MKNGSGPSGALWHRGLSAHTTVRASRYQYLNAERLDVEEQERHADPHGDQEDVLP